MNKKFCVTPVNIYHRAMIEQWLNANADQGLFPTKIGTIISVFNSRADLDCKFYLEPRMKGQHGPTLHGSTNSEEWSYVCPVSRTFFLFSANKSVPAPDDDMKVNEQIEKWKRETKRSLLNAIMLPIVVLMLCFSLVFLFSFSKFDVQPNPFARLPLLFLNLCNPFFIFLVLCSILSGAFNYIDSRSFSTPSPKKLRRRNGFLLVLSVGILLFGINALLHTPGKPIEDFSQPYIKLSELEDVPLSSWETLYGQSSFHDSENQVEYINSLLAPKAHVISQKYYEATSTNDTGFSPAGTPYHYAPSLETAYFQLLFPALSRPIAESQMDIFRLVNLEWNYTELSFPGLDFVILAHAEDYVWQMAALGQGNRIAIFQYGGIQNLEDHLPILAKLVIS